MSDSGAEPGTAEAWAAEIARRTQDVDAGLVSPVLETTSWFVRRSSKVAARFVTEIELALARIAEAPRRWPTMDDKHRKLLVRHFP